MRWVKTTALATALAVTAAFGCQAITGIEPGEGLGAGGAPPLPCSDDDGCIDDTFCGPSHVCVPWTTAHSFDPDCIHLAPRGVLSPALKCQFTAAPKGDPFPDHIDVPQTPLVARFRAADDPGPPSIVAIFETLASSLDDTGVIRVLRGDDCSVEAVLGDASHGLMSASTPAIGDLDGDGIPEVVAAAADGTLVAFTKKNGRWSTLWTSPVVAANHLDWGGASIHDLDGDGVPEVLFEGAVVSGKDGHLLSAPPADYTVYGLGAFSIVADLDGDGTAELADGEHVWKWQSGAWAETAFVPMSPSVPPPASITPAGHVAVADLGDYGAGVSAESFEIVVVRQNQVMIYALDGSFVMPPVDLPESPQVPYDSQGGPPIIADFDGDGLPEVGVAGKDYYVVLDLDCGPNPRPGGVCTLGLCEHLGQTCPGGDYVAWTRRSRDTSVYSFNAASAFDFEGDGRAEVVYGDQCFVRAYDTTGTALFSQYRSSCTWMENPLVADTDGDFRADLVVPSAVSTNCSDVCTHPSDGVLDANGVDVELAGLRCVTGEDCVSGTCDAGLCRCTDDAGCCPANDADAGTCAELGYQCAPPPEGTPGTGNTCRAGHPHPVSGIRVYSDRNDDWTRARAIYNQHPYSVTNVNDDGSIPALATWVPNRASFRENVSGNANPLSVGDLTAGTSLGATCGGGGATLSAPVCNRGSDPVGAGISVGFYAGAQRACSTTTTQALQPGQCVTVSCTWPSPPTSAEAMVDVSVLPNDDGARVECHPGNNRGTVLGVFCAP